MFEKYITSIYSSVDGKKFLKTIRYYHIVKSRESILLFLTQIPISMQIIHNSASGYRFPSQ